MTERKAHEIKKKRENYKCNFEVGSYEHIIFYVALIEGEIKGLQTI